jgi:HSP20 family protein
MVERSHTSHWWPNVYEPLKRAGQQIADWFAPKSDAAVSRENYRISLELPGVDVSDINLSVHGDALVVKGEKRVEHREEGDSYFFSEREYGAFQRSFRLPADADTGRIRAGFKNGVLVVTIPKMKTHSSGSKVIEIETD